MKPPTKRVLQVLVWLHGVKFAKRSSSRLLRFIAKLPFMPKNFLTGFWTTIGRTIYVPDHVSDPYLYPMAVSHELVHVRQRSRFPVLFELTYLLLPFPVFLAYGRWYWERQAFMQNLMVSPSPATVESIVNALWSQYCWTWPRCLMRRWFNKQLEKL